MSLLLFSILYFLYSGVVDVFVSIKINQMQLDYNKADYNNVNNITNIDNFDFLSTIHPDSKIVEKLEDRKMWNNLLNKKTYPELLSGKYQFVYRNQPNFEEKISICKRTKTIHSFFLKKKELCSMDVYKDKVIMTDTFIFAGFIKLMIKWYGNLNYNKKVIHWKKTFLFHPFGIKENPKMCEKLIKVPWKITHKLNDIYVFETSFHKKIAYLKIK